MLRAELEGLGARGCHELKGGVRFRGDVALGYRACLWLRSAIRVQLELAQAEVHREQALYDFIRDQEWERYIDNAGTVAVSAALNSSFLTHSQFAAQLVKDAVVDRFRDLTGDRPSVDIKEPDLPIHLFLNRDHATLSIDLAGRSLHKRGYRDAEQHKSPLNEALAAGLVLASEWDLETPLVDPMCGSATLLIEAARMVRDVAPGLQRSFAFERWHDLDKDVWSSLFDEAEERQAAGAKRSVPIEGADSHPGSVVLARRAADAAGVGDMIRIRHTDAKLWEPSFRPGMVLTNPPYGERIGHDDELERSWRALGDFLHRQKGATAWVLSGNPQATQFLRLSSERRMPVANGGINCRWIRYQIRGETP